MSCKKILVTGAAGFIGYHLCEALIKLGHLVVGLDNINDYYDINLKYSRLAQLGIKREKAEVFNLLSNSEIHSYKMKFIRLNLQDREELPNLFKENNFDFVCNLAAQPGVRYSIENPNVYVDSNITGFLNILECCRNFDINRFVYGSSSSVYGNSCNIPFKEIDNVDKPISLYAASKKSNELMAHAYSQLFNIETIGLRFFTVYGPWGRPDMALFLFTDAIINNKPIKVFNNGNLSRDFTFIDDIISGILKTLLQKSRNSSLYKIYNIGNSFPIKLTDFINLIEKNTNRKAKINMLPMQAGDVNQTWADINELKKDYKYSPKTKIENGVKSFINWYKFYYNLN